MGYYYGSRAIQIRRWFTLLFITVDLLLLAWLAIHLVTSDSDQSALESNTVTELTLPNSERSVTENSASTLKWTYAHVQPHDTLSHFFETNHLKHSDLEVLSHLDLAKHYLNALIPGKAIAYALDTQGVLIHMALSLAQGNTLNIDRQGDTLKAHLTRPETASSIEYASNTIRHSLHQSASKAGLSPAQIAELTKIFHQKINFSRDIRPGDRFSVLLENTYHNGVKTGTGHILAADFTNHGTHYQAIRYQLPGQDPTYFSPDGHSLKHQFLEKPLQYNRISSYFSFSRIDPILHKLHPHLGIDFAAPRGTPVHSISEGKIAYIGKKGGYGNVAIIQYGTHYRALYGHLSHFAKNLRAGSTVNEGQTIAYVGSTGWSTGPHLHYSFYVDGVPQNPLKVKLPESVQMPKRYLSAFHLKAKALLAELNLQQGPQFS